MKLYTRTGDTGRTGLVGGGRVDKDDSRVEAYGSVDELNAAVGLALVVCDDAWLRDVLTRVQNQLFDLGAELATPPPPGTSEAPKAPEAPGPPEASGIRPAPSSGASDATGGAPEPRIGVEHVAEIETAIDRTCEPLPSLKAFVLPGGCELAARLHLARTICRRAERRCVSLSHQSPIADTVIIYLNRVSDLLFAMARRANQLANVDDVAWTSGATTKPPADA